MSTATPTRISAGTWALDPVHSVAGFRVKHFGLTWLRGKMDEFELQLVAGEDGAYRIAGSAPIESISFPNEQLHGHLMSADFFDAQLHPRIDFESTSVDFADDGTTRIAGDLTIKGTTLPVELAGTWSGPVEGLGGETRIGIEVEGEIDRDAYGVSWQATLPTGQEVVSRGVKLEGEFELALQS